ncbi:IPT/TIG domain-containing protein [uncultured Jatrophihabitans sp.]|uniref:IPT/TIG domain-containing protein n=1 Tax=uncultured Jatrophihabitans sp. TaxID=1610747 RepID=UPI0035CAC30E
MASTAVVVLTGPGPAAAATATRADVLASAYAIGHNRGYHVGIAVLDTKTGRTYRAGDHGGTFASESVVKVLIATRVYLQGRLHGSTARRMYTMIAQSDDQIASSTYGSVGGDGLVAWIKKRFNVPNLGSGPRRSGWWGNTHITADGMVALYGKLKKLPRFGAWLLTAMHHATRRGSDGYYQWFGLKAANSNAAIKQGWGTDYDNWGSSADENTTGFVNGDRYAIAILARGPAGTYGGPISAMLTATAKRLLPGGVFPSEAPIVTSLGVVTTGRTAGGTVIAVHGRNLSPTTAVYLDGVKARILRRVSSYTVTVSTPAHAAGAARVRVTTPLGRSSAYGPTFTYIAPPVVTSVSPGQAAAGATVTVGGQNFVGRVSVQFGTTSAVARVTSSSNATVIVPAGPSGTVDLRVITLYGTSNIAPGDQFSYLPPDTAPPSAPTATPTSTAPAASPPVN